jgi:hypothetical protein
LPPWWAWLPVLAVAAALRLWQLRDQLLADDEWHALNKVMSAGPREIMRSFGFADHSIPLTLLYEALAAGPGLDEWTMRLPLLAAGLVSVVLMPWLLRGLARADEQLVFGLLIALSPLLVYFSRTARPYALSVLLAFAAVVAFRHWWLGGGHRWAATYVVACALAAWLHPLTLATTLAPLAFHGMQALWLSAHRRQLQPIGRVVGVGGLAAMPLAALLGPPIVADLGSLAGKAGVHRVTPDTLVQAVELFAGSALVPVAVAWGVLAFAGLGLLVRRDAATAAYWLFVVVTATVLVVVTGGAWIHHPLVLARYLLPLLPMLLWLVAIAIAAALRPLPGTARALALLVVAAGLYMAGPLPAQYHGPINQFTGHMSYQFDYDPQRNLYNQQLRPAAIHPFYRDLASRSARSLTLVEAPWYIEWHWNAWHFDQAVHHQRVLAGFVTGLCVESAYGEYPPGQPDVHLRHVVHLADLQPGDPRADYVVIHHRTAQPNARPVADLDRCIDALRQRLGPPVVDDDELVVFGLRAASGERR